MSDDIWRQDEPRGPSGGRRRGPRESEMDEFDDEEFGGPLFGDDDESAARPAAEEPEEALRFGDDTGPLPHWTEPATGEVPRIESTRADEAVEDDLDVWSSFTTESPVWKEGDHVDRPSGTVRRPAAEDVDPLPDPTGELNWEDAPAETVAAGPDEPVADVAPTGEVLPVDGADADVTSVNETVPPREPARITIGTDPSGMPRRPVPGRRGAPPQRPLSNAGAVPGSDRRNLPVAVASGLLLAAVFLGLTMWRPVGALVFVTIALGLAAVEYFGKVTEKGYRPAVPAGLAAVVALPLVAYWVGELGLPLVIVFGFFAGAIGFMGAPSVESGPMPNMAITTLGVVWIGLMGSYAALMLDWSNFGDGTPWGTDTLVLTALGIVANDVGAYFVGTAFGRTPLRAWISPGKSLEGVLGGTILTIIVMVIIGLQDVSDTWSDMSHLFMLAIVISVFAPLGDLVESMFKRNLDVKDFGAIIRGHGGVLDRFDGFLFTLPAVYYLFLIVEPYAA